MTAENNQLYSEQPVTQVVREEKVPGLAGISVLRHTYCQGWRTVLNRPYYRNLKAYVERMQAEPSLVDRRIALAGADRETCLQAYEIWRNACDDLHSTAQAAATQALLEEKSAPANSYDYEALLDEEDPETEEAEEESDHAVQPGEEDTILADEEVRAKQQEEAGPQGMQGMLPGKDKAQALIEAVGRELLYLGSCADGQKALDKVRENARQIRAVGLTKGGSSEFILKELSFEDDFEVVELGSPSMEDLQQAASSYLRTCGKFLLAEPYKTEEDLCKALILELRAYRGSAFREKDLYLYFRKAFLRAKGNHVITRKDFFFDYTGSDTRDPEQELSRMIGLRTVKEQIRRQAVRHEMALRLGSEIHGSLVFSGNPGTAKSTVALLYARILALRDIANGMFVSASAADIIGQYLGQTQAKVRALFARAKGGVLFVDEASCLIPQDGGDLYTRQALTEFVRFMETDPSTTVIFATYPGQAKRLLESDRGLQSRISAVINFPAYTSEELWKIFLKLAEDRQASVAAAGKTAFLSYILPLMKESGFGNGRECRKLLEAAMDEYGLEQMRKGRPVVPEDHAIVLSSRQIEAAAAYLTPKRKANVNETVHHYGFLTPGVTQRV